MSLLEPDSAVLRVTCREQGSLYDLRWHSAADVVVPTWWLGIFDTATGELGRTEVLAPKLGHPDELLEWLVTRVGRPVAGRLVALVAEELSQTASAS